MKNNCYIKLLFSGLFVLAGFAFCGCNDDPEYTRYEAVPRSEIGRKLVEGTNLIAHISVDSTYVLANGASVTELRYLSASGLAMAAFFFEIDLTSPDIALEVCTPQNKPIGVGFEPVTQQAMHVDAEGHRVLGGTNADFGSETQKGPQGIFWKDGVAQKTVFNTTPARPRSFFAIRTDKRAVAAAAADYDEIAASKVIYEAVGGGPVLVDDGVVPIPPDPNDLSVEPRTCIGVSEDGTKVWIMVVDGRNFYYSNGMSFVELGQFMKAVGSYDAINLDGGGSSSCFVRSAPGFSADDRFEIRNWPTDGGGVERAVCNGLLIVSNK